MSQDYRQWAINMVTYFVTPYIPLLFTLIPFSATLEIMSVFLLGLVVIIPTVMGGWNEFSNDRMIELLKAEGDDSTDDVISSSLLDYEDVFIHLNRKFITSSDSTHPSIHP